MKKSKSMLLLLTFVLAVGTLLSACGSKDNSKGASNGGNTTNNSGTQAEEKLAADQTLRFSFTSEVPTFDPGQAQDNVAHTMLNMMYEGLVAMDEDGQVKPANAESWEIDGTKYTFKLRKDAKWTNGDPVTAKDYVFAWERVLSPETSPAPPYANMLYDYIQGAKEFNEGKTKDFSTVGVKALDDYTLEVNIINPTPYFLGLTSFYTYFPVHKSVTDDVKWATNKDKMITNGPFKLTGWEIGQSYELAKNDNYHSKDDVKLTKIQINVVESAATQLQAYKNGETDYTGQPVGEIPSDQLPSVRQELKDEFNNRSIASIYYYQFNVTAKPFDNAKIRKAFSMAIDRQTLIDKVTLGGETAAFGFVPYGIVGADGQEYRKSVPDNYLSYNVEDAKKLLEEGMKEANYTKLPEITLLYNTSENHKKIALAIGDMWKKALGVDIKLLNQEFQVYISTRRNLDYQVSRAGWVSDYNDPMAFMSMWTTGDGNNDAGYSNKEYDQLISDAKKIGDEKARQEMIAKAEKILIEDDSVAIPLYYYTTKTLIKPNLKNVHMDYSGAVDFSRAYLVEE